MKYRFFVENLENGDFIPCKTLKDVAFYMDVPYHQARSVLLSDDKLFLHENITALKKRFKISKTTPDH